MINFKFTFVHNFGGVAFNLQETLDKIFPRLTPALFTGFVYWLLGKKGMNSTKVIFIVIAIAIGVSAISSFAGIPILGV